jgi:hypothetical protein
MKNLKDIFNEALKPKVYISTDNFTSILAEDNTDDINTFKINITDEFSDKGILELYKSGASKYNLTFEIADVPKITAHISGTSSNLIKFLLDIAQMLFADIKQKYPKLDFTTYEKLNK